MGVIAEVLNATETIMTAYPELVFTHVGPALQDTLKVAGVVSLVFAGLNQILNFRQITYSTYLVWAIRYICIVFMATVWSNFAIFYNVFIDLPTEYAYATIASVDKSTIQLTNCHTVSEYLGPIKLVVTGHHQECDETTVITHVPITQNSTTMYDMLDDFGQQIFSIAKNVIGQFGLTHGSTYKYLFGGLIIYIIGIIYIAASLVVLLISKVGLAVAMGLAPLAISMLTFTQTRGYFESWLRFTGGFAIVPLLVMSVVSVAISVANNIVPGSDFFGGFMPFVLVAIAVLVLLFQIPTMASQLAQTSVPQLGAAMAAQAASRVSQFVKSPLTIYSAGKERMEAAVNRYEVTREKEGGGHAISGLRAFAAMTQSSQYRAERANTRGYQKANLDAAKNKNIDNHNGPYPNSGRENPPPPVHNAPVVSPNYTTNDYLRTFENNHRNQNSNSNN